MIYEMPNESVRVSFEEMDIYLWEKSIRKAFSKPKIIGK
jgi:hypothetical protein